MDVNGISSCRGRLLSFRATAAPAHRGEIRIARSASLASSFFFSEGCPGSVFGAFVRSLRCKPCREVYQWTSLFAFIMLVSVERRVPFFYLAWTAVTVRKFLQEAWLMFIFFFNTN